MRSANRRLRAVAGKAGGLEEALFELQVAIKHLLKNIKAESTARKDIGLSGVKLPKVPQCSHFWRKGSKLERLLGTVWRYHPLQDRIE